MSKNPSFRLLMGCVVVCLLLFTIMPSQTPLKVSGATPDPTTPPSCDTSSTIKRASVASTGTQGNANSFTYGHGNALSGNGRYLVFGSGASNLVSADSNGATDIFLRDVVTCQTTRVSVASNGQQANTNATGPTISADGRYVAFESVASNLASGDTNNFFDVFVHDTQTGLTTRVSVASNGTQGNGNSDSAAMSADGRYIAFESAASTLVSGDTNGFFDVFVHDMQTGTTTRVSVDSNGNQTDGASMYPSISADGRYVAFQSTGTNLVSGDSNSASDIFVHDMQTGQTSRVSVDSNGQQANGASIESSFSANGRYVAFASTATNLISGDTNGMQDIFVHDMQTGQTTCVSVDSNGNQTDNTSSYPALSSDGGYAAFESTATNLVSGDTNGKQDIFIHNTQTGQTTRASVDANGNQGNDNSYNPAFSPDGRYVAFFSYATNLVSSDTNGVGDVFLAPVTTGPGGAWLTAPSSTITSANPTFTWQAGLGDEWYYLWLTGPNGFAFNQWYNTFGLCTNGNCSVTPTLNLGNGTYTYWVETWGGGITGPWSSGLSFTVTGQTPGAATPISPNGSSTVTNPTFTWQTGTGAEWYYLWVSGPNGLVLAQWYNGYAICSSGTCSISPTLNLTNGGYAFWVETWGGGVVGPWSNAMYFTVTGQTPGIPVPIAPTGTISTGNPAFSWSSATNAEWYYLWIEGPSGTVLNEWFNGYSICSAGTCSVTPSLNMTDGAYTWWVEGWGGGVVGTWSSGVNFTVSLPVPLPTFQPKAQP